MRIGLFVGTGYEGVGTGSLQQEWASWAQKSGHEVVTFVQVGKNANDYLKTPGVIERTGPSVHVDTLYPFEFTDSNGNTPDLIVTICTPYPKGHGAELTANISEAYRRARENGAKVLHTHVDYASAPVRGKCWQADPEAYWSQVDLMWTQGPYNPILPHVEEYLGDRVHFSTAQFTHLTAEEHRENWLPADQKVMNQLYWQGRPALWKGFREWAMIRQRLAQEGLEMNSLLNGISNEKEPSKFFTGVPKLNQPTFPEFEWERKKEATAFPETLLGKTQVFAGYDKGNALQLIRQAGFAGYCSLLDPNHLFFPENVTLELITSGTVTMVPDWYFDGSLYAGKRRIAKAPERTIIPMSPEEAGMIPFVLEGSLSGTADTIRELQNDSQLYDSYRERALDHIVAEYSPERILKPALEALGFTWNH